MRRFVRQNLWDTVLALVSLASGTLTALILAETLPATGWVAAAPGLATSSALFIVCAYSLKSRAKDHKLRAVQQECFTLIAGALVEIASHTQVDTTTLGASVFVVHRGVLQRLVRKPGTLRRVARLRFGGTPYKSRVKWTQGKGCVGRAWATGNEDYQSWTVRELEAQKDGSEAGRRGRESMTEIERKALAGKYCEVRAAAIVSSEGKVVGVLSVDRPAIHKQGKTQVVGTEVAKEVARATASLLAKPLTRS